MSRSTDGSKVSPKLVEGWSSELEVSSLGVSTGVLDLPSDAGFGGSISLRRVACVEEEYGASTTDRSLEENFSRAGSLNSFGGGGHRVLGRYMLRPYLGSMSYDVHQNIGK